MFFLLPHPKGSSRLWPPPSLFVPGRGGYYYEHCRGEERCFLTKESYLSSPTGVICTAQDVLVDCYPPRIPGGVCESDLRCDGSN